MTVSAKLLRSAACLKHVTMMVTEHEHTDN